MQGLKGGSHSSTEAPIPLLRRVSMAPSSTIVGVEGGASVLAANQLEAREGAASNLGL